MKKKKIKISTVADATQCIVDALTTFLDKHGQLRWHTLKALSDDEVTSLHARLNRALEVEGGDAMQQQAAKRLKLRIKTELDRRNQLQGLDSQAIAAQ